MTTDVDRARRHSLGDVLHRSACRYPDKLAVIDGDDRLTFAELEVAVNRIAHTLATRGLVKGDRLALLSRNCWEFGALVFAAAKVGVVLVPINFSLHAHEVTFILKDSGARGLVAGADLLGVAQAAVEEASIDLGVRAVIGDAVDGWESYASWHADGPTDAPDIDVADDDPVRLMYTSGTESNPKGVISTSRSLIAQYVSCIVDGGATHHDVEVHALPMYHCAQLDCFFCVDVYLGATSVILPAPTPDAVLGAIEEFGATKFFAPPTIWVGLLGSEAFETTDLSTLRKGYYGASPMPVEVLHEIRRRLPDVRLWNFYGQTELSPLVTILGPEEQLEHAGSAGRAALNAETIVVDDTDRPVPAGEIGEIVHRSPHVCRGYFNQQEKTAEAFRGGWFHSGDLGVIDADGYLTVVDRKKDMIKTGGENVASREVEEAIYEVPGVAEVAVFATPHPKWVEAVTAAVVIRPGSEATPESISIVLRDRLAGYKVPKHLVVVEELPKNPSGKIIKRQLREQFSDVATTSGE